MPKIGAQECRESTPIGNLKPTTQRARHAGGRPPRPNTRRAAGGGEERNGDTSRHEEDKPNMHRHPHL